MALAAGLVAPAAFAAPVQLTDAQLGAVPAGIRFSITNQVSDQPGVAPVTDPLLVNAWGLAQGPATALWVANNGTDTSTIYNGSTFAKVNLTVKVRGGPTGATFVGIPGAFNLSEHAGSQTVFAFATEDGRIEGWNPTVDLNRARTKVDESGAIFKGLTLGQTTTGPLLFAADFGHGTVNAYDTGFHKVMSFTDPNLPADFVPFNVQQLNGLLYVTFAQRKPGEKDETAGRGLGAVDVFDASGHLVKQLTQGGKLNAPWGLAIAPASFGKFAGALLVGNFGDGKINAYDPQTGKFVGELSGVGGKVDIDGLWALHSGPNGSITFSAGPAEESHGLVGSIAPKGTMWGGEEVASMAEMRH